MWGRRRQSTFGASVPERAWSHATRATARGPRDTTLTLSEISDATVQAAGFEPSRNCCELL